MEREQYQNQIKDLLQAVETLLKSNKVMGERVTQLEKVAEAYDDLKTKYEKLEGELAMRKRGQHGKRSEKPKDTPDANPASDGSKDDDEDKYIENGSKNDAPADDEEQEDEKRECVFVNESKYDTPRLVPHTSATYSMLSDLGVNRFQYALSSGREMYRMFNEKMCMSKQSILLHRTEAEVLDARKTESIPILNELDQRAMALLAKIKSKEVTVSSKLEHALNYMHNNWKELIAYIDVGSVLIDDRSTFGRLQGKNCCERAVRPFTNLRKSFGGFSSEKGGEVAAAWLTIIETCKLQKKAALDFFQEFFKKITEGRADYELIAQEILG